MTLTVSKPTRQDFVNALTGWQVDYAFTQHGASALYDYYSDLSDQTGEELYIDRDAICEQWMERSIDEVFKHMIYCGDVSCVIEEWLSANHEHYIRVQNGSHVGFVVTRN